MDLLRISTLSAILILISLSSGLYSCKSTPANQTATAKKYQLVWADEFEYEGLPDSSKWSYDIGGHGWGNQELQFYTEKRLENARVEEGMLIIEAKKESMNGMEFTSARLSSKNKGDWLYGRVEVKARLPYGRGTWPAIWMLPSENVYGRWPQSGEIDIMEHVGFDMGRVHGTVHTEAFNHMYGTQKAHSLLLTDVTEDFHEYAMEWTAEKIDFLIDGAKHFSFSSEGEDYKKWPFDHPFHLILNIAVGGAWGGQKGVDDSIWPQKMEVDYVRVFQQK